MKIFIGIVCLLIGGWAGMWMGFDMGVGAANTCIVYLLFNEKSVSTDELKHKVYACTHAGDQQTMQDLQTSLPGDGI